MSNPQEDNALLKRALLKIRLMNQYTNMMLQGILGGEPKTNLREAEELVNDMSDTDVDELLDLIPESNIIIEREDSDA